MGRIRPTLALTASVILAIGVTACGDDDDADTADTAGAADTADTGGAATEAPGTTTAEPATTAGEAATTAAGEETGDTGEPFTLGFTNPLGSNDQLSRAAAGDRGTGGVPRRQVCRSTPISMSTSRSPTSTSWSARASTGSSCSRSTAGRDPGRRTGPRRRDQDVGVNVSLEDPEVADVAPFDASVNQGTEQMATETAEFVIDQLGGQGNVLGVGIGFPVPVIEYQMAVMEETVTAGMA